MIVLLLAIFDLSRIYTTMITVESAAREAADFGTFGSQKWSSAVYAAAPPDGTESKMKRRACVASSALPDYVKPVADTLDENCTNPTFRYELSGDRGATWGPYDAGLGCDNPIRIPPCWLKVKLEYDFRLLFPFSLEMFGNSFGVPNTMTFERSSIFPMTDLNLP